MKRRDFLRLLGVSAILPSTAAAGLLLPVADKHAAVASGSVLAETVVDGAIKDQVCRTQQPDLHYFDDLLATPAEAALLQSAYQRLGRLQRVIGYGNFNIVSFDDAIRYARDYSRIGVFPAQELAALEALFYGDASRYGFFGEKPVERLTSRISGRDVIKIPNSGHFLYQGKPLQKFQQVRREVGASLVLTSGIRSVVKQMYLFLGKASHYDWNLSLASRSLAPPGYSFHGVGDFDVGKKGFAAKNFSAAFAQTDEFRRLVGLGYVKIRYPLHNELGVRFEPWHIKVV